MNELWVIYGFVFVAAILGIESLYWLVFGLRGAKKAVNRRLALSERNVATSEVFDILRHERGMSDNSSFAGLNDFLVQTGMRLSAFGLTLWTVGIGVAIAVGLTVLSINVFIAAIAGVTLGPALVGFYLMRARSKRIERFARQLPDALDVVVRGLRIGHPFTTAIELVAREMQDPIGTEFGMTVGRDVVRPEHGNRSQQSLSPRRPGRSASAGDRLSAISAFETSRGFRVGRISGSS